MLGLTDLVDIQVELSRRQWVLNFRLEGRQAENESGGVTSSFISSHHALSLALPGISLPSLCLELGRDGWGPADLPTGLLRWITWSPVKTPFP